MSNAIKLVSGFILFVIGVLIAYETITYNLLGILIIVGLFIAIVGILVIISYFIDTNADRTLTIIKDFLDSKEVGSSAFGKSGKNSNSNGPLRVRSEFNNSDLDDGYTDIYEENFYDDSNAVLNIPDEEDDVNFDNPLKFTPYYGRPLKVTRSPKRRKGGYYVEEVPEIVVEPNHNSEEIQTAFSELFGSLFDTHKELTLEIVEKLLNIYLPKYFNENSSTFEKKLGLLIIDDMVEFLIEFYLMFLLFIQELLLMNLMFLICLTCF